MKQKKNPYIFKNKYLAIFIRVAISALAALILYYSIWTIVDYGFPQEPILSLGIFLTDYAICFIISLIVSLIYWRSYIKVQRERDRFKLKTLENQINPHFVFNNFSILSGLIDENPEKAQKFLMNLSKVYRYNLSNMDKIVVTVSEELKFLDQYMEIMESRFGGTFSLMISPEVRLINGEIAPCSLQMLVENALKHNKHTTSEPLGISITTSEGYISISNIKQPLAHPSHSTKMGNKNLMERYSMLSDKSIVIDNSQDLYTIKLPILQNSQTIS